MRLVKLPQKLNDFFTGVDRAGESIDSYLTRKKGAGEPCQKEPQYVRNSRNMSKTAAMLGTAEMSGRAVFKGVYPIEETDPQSLPVKDVDSAIGYYSQVLGFSVLSREEDKAVLKRDDVTIGLAKNGADPDNASCYFDVENIDELHRELAAKGINPTDFRLEVHNDSNYRIFFCREPYGVCFCFGTPA